MNIVCVGDCGIDHYLPSNKKLFGGITANFARHARREFPQDDTIQLISAIGSDDAANTVMLSLESTGIEHHIARLDGVTPVQTIEVQPDGERKFVRYDEGVLRDFRLLPDFKALITASDLLVAPVYLQIVGMFDELMSIRTAGKVSVDFADFLQHPDFGLLDKYIDNIDIGFFGLAPSDQDEIETLRKLAILHDKLFVVTLGADGSIVLRKGELIECTAVHVGEVVDTTGAGDAFAAGFLSRYCHGGSLHACLRKGADVAAGVIQHMGAFIPSDRTRPQCKR